MKCRWGLRLLEKALTSQHEHETVTLTCLEELDYSLWLSFSDTRQIQIVALSG